MRGTGYLPQGAAGLSRWDFEKDGIFALHSQWEFYWNRLLTPNDFSGGDPIENRAFFPVPGLWGGFQLRPSPYTGDGFATYRLRIKMDPGQRNLALRVGLIQTAYNIWINGERVGAGGIVGKRPEDAEPQAEVKIYRFAGTGDTIELIVQVANYFQSRGGMRGMITLGTADQITRQQNRMIAFDLTLFGCLLFRKQRGRVFILDICEFRESIREGVRMKPKWAK